MVAEEAVGDSGIELLPPIVEQPLPPPIPGEVRLVRNLTHDQFRTCLVEHFNILFLRNKIKWPCRRLLQQDEQRRNLEDVE